MNRDDEREEEFSNFINLSERDRAASRGQRLLFQSSIYLGMLISALSIYLST